MPATFDIWDQAVLTQLVNEEVDTNLEREAFLGNQIAPLFDISSRMVKVQMGRMYSFGVGQAKAPDAIPALIEMPLGGEREEVMMELVLLEEMHRINGEQWRRLQSNDPETRAAEGLDVLERGRILQTRMERATEKYRWQAFSGAVTIVYPTGSQHVIDYAFLPGHKPVVADLWSAYATSDPIGDIEAWQQKLADDSGHLGTKIHLTSKQVKNILRSDSLKTYYNIEPGRPFRPVLEDVARLLADGTEFVVYDAGYRPMQNNAPIDAASHIRYLPDNNVLVTTPYTVEGEKIADTPNGQVEISTGYDTTAILAGPQSEVILDHMTKNRYLRQAAARIPRINHPECFLWATVDA